jgi:hypothetical protein
LFDKVMVLSEGRQVFYGPPSEARGYFESLGYQPLPRQSTADYLTGCTDPNERQFAAGRSANDTPSTPEAMESAFKSSKFCQDLEVDREKYKLLMATEREDQEAFRAAVAADKKKGVSKKSPYTLGFTGQVRALTTRQFQMRLQDRFQLYTSFTLSTILSLVLGAAFLNLPTTSAGAFTRGGVIFSALLTTCLDAFGEMPMQMLGRPILRKQTSYSMYRPSAIAVANTLADIPFSAARVLIFNIPVYFMSNLSRTAGGFWTFHLFNYVAYLTMQGEPVVSLCWGSADIMRKASSARSACSAPTSTSRSVCRCSSFLTLSSTRGTLSPSSRRVNICKFTVWSFLPVLHIDEALVVLDCRFDLSSALSMLTVSQVLH